MSVFELYILTRLDMASSAFGWGAVLYGFWVLAIYEAEKVPKTNFIIWITMLILYIAMPTSEEAYTIIDKNCTIDIKQEK